MIRPWKLLGKEVVFKKYSITIERRDFILPDGVQDEFYIFASGSGAAVLALTEDNKVVTIRQFRPGPNKVLTELPGGFIEEGDTPEQTAAKELLEETGYAGEVEYVGEWFEDAYLDKRRTISVAKNCKQIAGQNLEQNEFAEVQLMELPDFIKVVRSGQMTDTAGAMLALDYLKLL